MGWGMKQLTLAGFERYAKRRRWAAFLAEMERVVPWPAMAACRSGSSGCCGFISCSGGSICRTTVEEALYDSLGDAAFRRDRWSRVTPALLRPSLDSHIEASGLSWAAACYAFPNPAISWGNSDAGRSESVAADLRLDAGLPRSPADHVEGVFPIQRPLSESVPGFPVSSSKERPLVA